MKIKRNLSGNFHIVGRLGVLQDVAACESGFSLEKVGQVTLHFIFNLIYIFTTIVIKVILRSLLYQLTVYFYISTLFT